MYMYRNSVRLLYFVHWVITMNCGFQNGSAFQNGSLEWNFRMEVHSRVEFQNGSEFHSGISEWKCIPEWNIYVELNGPYGLPYKYEYEQYSVVYGCTTNLKALAIVSQSPVNTLDTTTYLTIALSRA